MNHVSSDLTDEQLDELLYNIKTQGVLLKEQRVFIVGMALFSAIHLMGMYFENSTVQWVTVILVLGCVFIWNLYRLALNNLKKEFKKLCKNG